MKVGIHFTLKPQFEWATFWAAFEHVSVASMLDSRDPVLIRCLIYLPCSFMPLFFFPNLFLFIFWDSDQTALLTASPVTSTGSYSISWLCVPPSQHVPTHTELISLCLSPMLEHSSSKAKSYQTDSLSYLKHLAKLLCTIANNQTFVELKKSE